ncbi:FYDLN acid domain-containing protein [Sandaracinobacteroides hominis]|uniref:FYDLN acid domain-containing protein n=1 Tax=Sandaracinobacteroides hominis TaxID=2780086 RepID=UPI0018F69D0D|nr:FYDLN acid domain-containing protein [Sandaracinobacteroides hominis]
MIKAEWGTKRQCPKCGTRFYDLQSDDPVTCIACGNAWVPEPILKSKQTLPFEAAKAEESQAEPALETDDLDIDADSDEPSEDSDVDIGGDSDDIAEVVVEDREEDR